MQPVRTLDTRRLPRTLRRWRIALGRMPWWRFVAVMFPLTLAAKLLASLIMGLAMPVDQIEFATDPAQPGEWFFTAVLVPLFETLVAQAFVISLLRRLLPRMFLVPVVVSALVFGLLHPAGFTMLCMTLVGLLWAFGYASRQDKRGFASAFWLTAGVHALNKSLNYILP